MSRLLPAAPEALLSPPPNHFFLSSPKITTTLTSNTADSCCLFLTCIQTEHRVGFVSWLASFTRFYDCELIHTDARSRSSFTFVVVPLFYHMNTTIYFSIPHWGNCVFFPRLGSYSFPHFSIEHHTFLLFLHRRSRTIFFSACFMPFKKKFFWSTITDQNNSSEPNWTADKEATSE